MSVEKLVEHFSGFCQVSRQKFEKPQLIVSHELLGLLHLVGWRET